MTVRLPLVVGWGRAMEMIVTGRPVDAEEALRIGLANEIVPRGEAHPGGGEATVSMFMRRDPHSLGARAFKQRRAPEWPHRGL